MNIYLFTYFHNMQIYMYDLSVLKDSIVLKDHVCF